MKKVIVLIVLFCVVVCGQHENYINWQHKNYINKTNYILFKKMTFAFTSTPRKSPDVKKNAALLITNKKEIAENERLFHNNYKPSPCGHEFNIQFWQSADKQLDDIIFEREDCGDKKLNQKMEGYIKQLETKPTHYIYNLQIPVTVEPDEVIKSFKGSGFNLFFMDKEEDRYVSLSFSYLHETLRKEIHDRSKWLGEQDANKEKAIQKVNAIVDSIKKISTIIKQPEIEFPMASFGRDVISHTIKATVYFKNGMDLQQVKEIIKRNNSIIGQENRPLNYCVQLVDTLDNLETIKEKLKGYTFVTGIYEYPNSK